MHAPLPVHPLTGLTATGWRKARPHRGEDDELYPVWPILGGAPDEDDDQDDDAGDGDEGDDDGQDDDAGDGDDGQDDDGAGDQDGDDDADQLGEAGKKALDRWKARAKQAEQRLAEAGVATKTQSRKAAASAQTDRTQSRKAAESTQTDVENAVLAKANARIIRSEVRAAAAGKLSDPRDALRFLDLDQFEVDEDGVADEDKIAEAIEDLVKNKPYLAAQGRQRFQGTGDGGAARKAGRPKQLTERDLTNMTAEQIVKAQDEGKLDNLLGGG